ncbi:MAG TPA: SUMF1/EgtB/PvdO family nonheme iron enzyme [Stellaceae bacterium]|nr:SUMF1/EgtB/PvdO family nonheme iron enzyme [Stellaceae bacterium]
MPHDVFVSHSSKDKLAADALVAALEAKGIRCWVAPRDILPGADWSESIIEAIYNTKVMVLIFSAHANDSPQIKREVERAVNRGKPVIPLRIEDVAPSRSLEYFISTPHWLDAFTPPFDRHLHYLADVIARILTGPAEANAARGEPSDAKQEAAAPSPAAIPHEIAAHKGGAVRRKAGLAWLLGGLGAAAVALAAILAIARMAPSPPQLAAAGEPAAGQTQADAEEVEITYWKSIKDSKDPADFREYLKQFPEGSFAGLARNREKALQPAAPQVAAVPPPAPQVAVTPPPAPQVAVATPPAPPGPASGGLPPVGHSFLDCANCPMMVVISPGRFMMGTETAETARERVPDNFAEFERPRHAVTVRNALAVGKYNVMRGEYERFVQATGYDSGRGCAAWTGSKFESNPAKSWRDPGFAQTDRDPVVCVSWADAWAYAAWLARMTGKTYRLPTESEWEYAARGGTMTARWWGDEIGRGHANCAGCGSQWDRKSTSPAGSFAANPFGLFDMLGDAAQWTEDCFARTWAEAPSDSAIALTSGGDCTKRGVRGGGWNTNAIYIRAGSRGGDASGIRASYLGFRVVRSQ